MAITKEVLDELLKDYKGPEDITGPNGLLKQLSKAVIERAWQAEMTEQLGYEKSDRSKKDTENRRNGKTTKTLRTEHGLLEIEVPRDRTGNFESEIVPKHQRDFKGFNDKILAMYSRGMTTRDITETLKEIYRTEVSPKLIIRVTDSVKDLLNEWRKRRPMLFILSCFQRPKCNCVLFTWSETHSSMCRTKIESQSLRISRPSIFRHQKNPLQLRLMPSPKNGMQNIR